MRPHAFPFHGVRNGRYPPIAAIHGRNHTSPWDQTERLEGRLIEAIPTANIVGGAPPASLGAPPSIGLMPRQRLGPVRPVKREATSISALSF